MTSLIAAAILLAGLSAPLFLVARRRIRQATAMKLAKYFNRSSDDTIPLAELEKRTGVRKAEDKLRMLIRKDYIDNVAIDADRDCVRLGGKPWNDPSPTQKAILRTGVEAYDEKLNEIRTLNDNIKNWKVSAKIDRIEQLTSSIFQVISERPDRADDARRFMNYYLPTTLKLLESYALMEKQSYQGENIQISRKKIEDVLDTIIRGMEGLQDKLFSTDVLDVETDISVVETLMSADGLLHRDGGLHQ